MFRRLFRFYTETESFGVLIEPKQTEELPKQFDREHILVFFSENLGLFGLFRNSLFHFYTETESFDVSIEPKQTEDQPKKFDREHISVFFRKFRSFRFVSKQFCLSQLFRYRFKTPKQTVIFVLGFTKLSETDVASICFGSNQNFVCLFRGHPTPPAATLILQQASGQIYEDDVNGFSSISDICFMNI